MEEYKQAIYDFLTRKENFQQMIRVMDHFNDVRSQLLLEFWQGVKGKLEEMNSRDDDGWVIHLVDDIYHKKSQLKIYKKEWLAHDARPLLCVAYESLTEYTPYYGLWINRDHDILDVDRVAKYSRSLGISKRYKSDGNMWWGIWEHATLRFGEKEEIGKLLPETRDVYISEFAETLYNLAKELSNDLDHMFTFKLAPVSG